MRHILCSGLNRKQQDWHRSWKQKEEHLLHLQWVPPVAPPPQFVYDKLAEALKIPQIHTYSSPKGENFYLEAIAKKMKNRFNVELDPQTEIFSLIGSKEGIANFIRALINPTNIEQDKDIILVPDPGYASYSQMIKTNGGISYPISLNKENNYMPDMNKIWENLIKDGLNPSKVKAMMINYPSNPLGATCTKDYLKHVVDFCKEKQIWLMSDAAYCDIYFEEQAKPHSIFEIEGAKDVAVEFYSFSKPYSMTGFRLGWICGNKEAVGTFGRLKSTIDTGLFKALQKCAAAFSTPKKAMNTLNKQTKALRKNSRLLSTDSENSAGKLKRMTYQKLLSTYGCLFRQDIKHQKNLQMIC